MSETMFGGVPLSQLTPEQFGDAMKCLEMYHRQGAVWAKKRIETEREWQDIYNERMNRFGWEDVLAITSPVWGLALIVSIVYIGIKIAEAA